MKLPVDPGEKYALIALDAAADFKDMFELGAGVYALPHTTFDMPKHWKEWLGTIKTEAIQRAGLVRSRSSRPTLRLFLMERTKR